MQTLNKKDIYNGAGEMINMHAINSPESFDLIASSYEEVIADFNIMERFIYRSLLMKIYCESIRNDAK